MAVGDSTRLEIIFSTKTYSKKVTKRPSIKTNEGPPDRRVGITATIVPRPDSTYPLVMKPYKLDLSQFGDKVRDEISFKISNVSDQEVDLSMISSYGEYFEVKLPNSIGAGKTAEGKLKLTQTGIDKGFEKSFTLEVSDELKSRFTMPVKRTIRPSSNATTTAVKGKSGRI